ncbi:TetR/AcrR family transcriptional regulator [Ottowia thiooxydans]|uniref:TetR/AcrR family transcriptional regulator n=1 Tax=Ottowia thiooxydans TaxID=219182 RepID=UPI0003FBAC34|nr:TetR/AcrR family transcriptional regulator [Ottowia thiooxydans]
MARHSVRQQIVDASLEVFQAHGYNATSIQDLTDAAGVPKGSFYNHFKGKEDLALEALKLYVESNGIDVLRDERYAPIERLRRHFRANWKIVKDRDYTAGCFLGTMSSEIADTHATSRAAFAEVFEAWSRAIAQVVHQAQEKGDIANTSDPKLLGRFILNAWQGALVRMKVAKNDEPFKDFSAVVFDVLLHAPGN